jgi:energy-coupling factor transport system ATP-binding protein
VALINVDKVSFNYPNGYNAVKDISFEVNSGDNIAIIGQNGAGKTTTVKMLNGLLKPTQGDVFVQGKNTKDYTTAQISQHVGYVFQNPDDQIFNNTVFEEIAYALRKHGYSEDEINTRVKKYAALCGVEDILHQNPYDLPLSIRKLVTIASIIVTDAEVVILDEPTAGQDLLGLNLLSELITLLVEEGRAVITITHDMEFVADNFDDIIVMATKEIQKIGTAEEVFFDQEMMDKAALNPPTLVSLIQSLDINTETLEIADFIDIYENVK